MKKIVAFYGDKTSTALLTAVAVMFGGLAGVLGSELAVKRDGGVEGTAVSEQAENAYRQRLEGLRASEARIVKLEKAVSDLDTQVLIDEKDAEIRKRFEAAKRKLSSEKSDLGGGVQAFFNDLVMDARLDETRVDDIAKDSAKRLAYRYASPLVEGNASGSEIYLKFSNADLRECQITGAKPADVAACSRNASFERSLTGSVAGGALGLGGLMLLPYAAAFRRRKKDGAAPQLITPEPQEQIVSTNIKVTYVQPKKD